MKKFYKILFLLLALSSIITAFTVIALATDSEKPQPVGHTQMFTQHEADDVSAGDIISNNTAKYGKWTAGVADNGNKYLVGSYDSSTATNYNGDNIEWTVPGIKNSIGKYPIFSIDFDILSTTGELSGYASLRTDLYSVKNGKYLRISQMTSGVKINSEGMNLSKVPNVWQHVTYIVEYAGNGVFNYYMYVDGAPSNSFVLDFNTTKFASIHADYGAPANWTELIEKNPDISIDKTGINTVILLSAYRSKTEELWYDNMQCRYFTSDYSIDEVASYVYNEDYEMPYGFTEAKVGDTIYDDINEAIEVATSGETVQTVKLTKNATKALIIDKNVTIDTNIYDESGNATGSFYTYEYKSSQGFVPTETAAGSGIYSFERSQNAVDIIWDEACDGDCDCYAEFGGHILTNSSVAILGNTPDYFGKIPTFETVNGYAKELVGWSRTKGSAAPDAQIIITEDDVSAGTLKLYPVYKTTQYNFSVTKGTTASYYMETDFASVLNSISSESTVTLHTDVRFDHSILLKSAGKVLTLDLNGYKLIRHYATFTTYDAVLDGATGEYVKSGEATGTVEEGRDTVAITTYSSGTKVYTNGIFGFNNKATVNLTSSRPGAEVHAYSVTADRLMLNGEAVKTENVQIGGGLCVFFLSPASSSTFNLDTENVTFYTGTLFSAEHGGNNSDTTININGGKFYTISGEGVIDIRRGETANIKDAAFYCNGVRFNFAKYNNHTNFNFENCDIYDSSFYASYAAIKYSFSDTRLANVSFNSTGIVVFDADVLTTNYSANYDILPGCVYTDATEKTYSYYKLNLQASYDSASGKLVPGMTLASEATTGSFTYETRNCSEVAESITEASTAILYYTDFDLVLYIPVTEGMTVDSVSGFKATEGTVRIDGKEYYAYKKTCTTVNASDTVNAIVKYTVNEKFYQQTFEVSALIYAELTLNGSLSDVEAKAIANMVRYIKEARLASSLEAGEEFDELIALGNLSELGAKENYADATVNYSALSGYVKSISFMVDGTFTAYVITMTDEAVAAGAEVTVSYVGGDAVTTTKDVITDTEAGTETTRYLTTKTKVYDIATKAIEITVTVPAAEEGGEPTVLTGTYSVKAYINATDNTLAKAMYEFGSAIKAYRDYILNI